MSYTELFYADIAGGTYRINGETVGYSDCYQSLTPPVSQPNLSMTVTPALISLFQSVYEAPFTLIMQANINLSAVYGYNVWVSNYDGVNDATSFFAAPNSAAFNQYYIVNSAGGTGGGWDTTRTGSYQVVWTCDATNVNTNYCNGSEMSGITPWTQSAPLSYITDLGLDPTAVVFIALYSDVFSPADADTYSEPGSRPTPSPPTPPSYTPNWQLPFTIPVPLAAVPCCQLPGGLCHC